MSKRRSFWWFEKAHSSGTYESAQLRYAESKKKAPHPNYSLWSWQFNYKFFISTCNTEKKLSSEMQSRFGLCMLPKSLLQNTVTLSALVWDVINSKVPFAITPDPKTITKVTRYATTLSIFTVSSRHFWFAMDPESTFIGGSLNTSHPLVSVTVLVLKTKSRFY